MNKNIENYIKHYPNYLNKELCKKTIKDLKNSKKTNWETHQYYVPSEKKYLELSGAQELSISYNNKIPSYDIIMKEIWNITLKYIQDLNLDWFSTWQGYSPVRFNKYSCNTKMKEHCDHISTLFEGNKGIPILSVLGVLNEDYKGGEFIMFQDTEIKFKTGDILVFPSIFLYPHKVEPVKKGTRYSFISWVY